MSAKVVTFGEIMLRLSTPGYQRFIQADSFNITYGGGEANVAVSLANFGLEVCFVTKLPHNPIGQSAVNHLRRFGVNTDCIAYGGQRLGVYYLETGGSQRPSQVIYDRAGSAIAEAKPGVFDWRKILNGASWFHVTGITPTLSKSAAEITLQACTAAKELGVTVSCDLNYRKKLWSREKANRVMSELMKYVDISVGNEEDADQVFGIKAPASDVEKGLLDEKGYQDVARQLQCKFDLAGVAITLRESYSASRNGWSGLLYDGKNCFRSRKYDIHIVDRVGGGDAFASGIIFGYLQKWSPQDIVEFATAASCLKHTVPGDFNMVSTEEVKKLAEGGESGRVQR